MSPTNVPPTADKPTPKMLKYLRYLAERSGTSFSYPHTAAEARREIKRLQALKADSRRDVERERRQIQADMTTRRGGAVAVRDAEIAGYGSSATWGTGPDRKPTEQQIDYICDLAYMAGETFHEPESFAEASKEIDRLLNAPPAPGPRVVHCKRQHYDVYVGRGRGSIWGNPFREGRDGTREQVIAQYERWLLDQPKLIAALPQLRGKTLGCWCAPKPCHADVLLRLANAPERQTTERQANGRPHAFAGYTVNSERRLIVVHRINGLVRVGDLPATGKGKRYLIADELRTCGELDDLLTDYTQQIARLHAIPAQRVAVDEVLELVL